MPVDLKYYPVAFTRPYKKSQDYQFFVCPDLFHEKQVLLEESRTFVANCTVATYDDGRWCLVKLDDKHLLYGKVLLKYNRFDEYGRGPLSGFYGVVMESSKKLGRVIIPTEEYFDWVDAEFIAPYFKDEKVECKYSSGIDIVQCPGLLQAVAEADFSKNDLKHITDEWNDDPSIVKLFPQSQFDSSPIQILFSAIKKAWMVKTFNVITHVNENDAEYLRLGILNAFSANESKARKAKRHGQVESSVIARSCGLDLSFLRNKVLLGSAIGVVVLVALFVLLSNTGSVNTAADLRSSAQ